MQVPVCGEVMLIAAAVIAASTAIAAACIPELLQSFEPLA
jgi:hypothetical protein